MSIFNIKQSLQKGVWTVVSSQGGRTKNNTLETCESNHHCVKESNRSLKTLCN